MSKWKTIKLGDICEIVTGSTPSTLKQEYWDGSFYWVTPAEISDGDYYIEKTQRKLTEAGISSAGLRIMPVGTVLLSSRAPIGKVAITAVEMACNQGFKNFVCGEKIHNRFLYYFLKNNKHYLNSLGRGATFKEISKSIVCEIEIPLPPLEEQKRIADILDKASNLIDLRKQQLEKMDLLMKSKFIDMFGDPVTNPKGWQVQRIEELCEAIFGGGTPSKSNSEYYDGDIPWVTSKDMKSILISDSIDHINDKAVLNSSAKYIPKQSLLMVIRSGILKHTLPLGINTRVVTINQDMKAFIPNANMNVWFMFYTFKMHEKSLLNNVRAVTADNIEFSIIRNLMVPVPFLELQNQFAAFVEEVEKQKAVMQQSLEKMETNYKALMQEYFG
ncbi:MAG: restriction endonuclease subunit S [Acidaminococcaceae bacterium]